MSSFNKGRLVANHCYKLGVDGLPIFETLLDSQKFFGNPAMLHVVLPQNRTTAPLLNSWTTHVTKLGRNSVPVYEFRLVNWIAQPWLIVTMLVQDVYGFTLHAEDYDHELSEAVPERKNGEGYLELFPFRGPNFRSLRQTVLLLENK